MGYRAWDETRALVTGASSGLGRAIAEHLVRAGATVVLTGRSAGRLDDVAAGLAREGADPARMITVPADLTVEEDRTRLFDEARDRLGALDVVVNNAGVGATGQFDTHDPSDLRRVFEVNVFATIEACRASLPLLAEGRDPVMVLMGSVNARRGLPGRSEYSASKFAVSGFAESIRIEWRRFGIHVLQVNPGFTDTPFDDNAVVKTARVSVKHRRTMSPDTVARATLRAIEARRREIVVSPHAKLFLLTSKLAPRFVDWGLTRWLFRHFPDAPALQGAGARAGR
ncbi:putative oxidoreductase [Aquisphaera giovannonii]|uniref:Putative oxidoreductase n=1 Tax=Aquisphaera giovannonii TaxID=406548 RepID=A0A5B9W3V4_9BACT|nr:SDR family NAD(P)-dependent oxidoreductase [Aquisphaera giovannonii]QEH34934.1 putative oxidoreductase [Aquisphaera giovannonii]